MLNDELGVQNSFQFIWTGRGRRCVGTMLVAWQGSCWSLVVLRFAVQRLNTCWDPGSSCAPLPSLPGMDPRACSGEEPVQGGKSPCASFQRFMARAHSTVTSAACSSGSIPSLARRS